MLCVNAEAEREYNRSALVRQSMTGNRIGYTSSYLPPEIIQACGLTPVRL